MNVINQCTWCRKEVVEEHRWVDMKKTKGGNPKPILYHLKCFKRKVSFNRRESIVTQSRVKKPLGNMTQ